MKKIIYFLVSIVTLATLPIACVDTLPEEVLEHDKFYAHVDDADKAIMGLYGQFMELAGQVVILNELRADLLDVTPYATTDLQEINLNSPSENNPWIDIRKFYSVIQTCNDILSNFDQMLDENRMIKAEYDERYSDVAALRTWVYFQLGIHFGKVAYITEPIILLDDISKAREMNLDDLMIELIRTMENLPTLEDYQASVLTQQQLDGYSLKTFFIPKKLLLGDLYLFNNDYLEAAKMYRDVLAFGEDLDPTHRNAYIKNRLYGYTWTSGTPDWYGILYRDGKVDDFEALYNAWRLMFSGTTTDRSSLEEWIWLVAYDANFKPQYPFLEIFNPVGQQGGKYWLKPSQYAVDSVWGKEIQKNGFPFDARGLTGSFENIGGENVVTKYSYYALAQSASTGWPIGSWFLYRAGTLHLRYAEAANRAGYPDLAWAFINDGLSGGTYVFKREDGSEYPGDSIKITGTSPFDPYPYPFNFDARYKTTPPRVTTAWRSNVGVRGRASLPNIPFPADAVTKQDSILFMEQVIISEAAKELGFEGNRWQDLLRIARRLNKETPGAGTTFLWDNNIKKKYDQAGVVGNDLSTEANWYLPFHR